MHQVDAFTDVLFGGNPAAVLVLENWLPDGLMLSIAQENNLAETAFTLLRADGGYDLRWFTPAYEVDFCGHATLATAHVLITEMSVKSPITFHTRVGVLRVEKVDDGYRLDFPVLQPEPLDRLPELLQQVFEVPPVHLFKHGRNIFADLGSAEAVRRFIPNLDLIKKAGRVGLVITGKEDESAKADFVSRYFAPTAGIPEDPVTGSIHTTLVPYWAERFGRNKLLAYQASPRGGWLKCELLNVRVLIVGQAVTFMEAIIHLPA